MLRDLIIDDDFPTTGAGALGAGPPPAPGGLTYTGSVGTGKAPGQPYGGTVTPAPGGSSYAGAGAIGAGAMNALPAGTVSNSYGTGGDPRNAGTWVQGRYTGAELYNMMQQLPPEARLAFYRSMIGQGQGGNDLQSQAITGFGGLDKLNAWINAEEAKGANSFWDPSTGQYSVKGADGTWTTNTLGGWNTNPYQGTYSAYGGNYGGNFALPPGSESGYPTGAPPVTAPPAGSGTPPGTTTTPPPGTTTTPPPGTTTTPGSSYSGVTPGGSNSQTLEARARQILGSYFITKPDGTPDWAAMSGNTDFYNSLPESIRRAVTDAHLGAAMRTEAGLPLLNGMTLPDWYAKAGSGVQSNGTFTPPTYNAPVYTPPPPQEVMAGNPMDFFNDAGYQFRLQEGKDAIENAAAARGGLLSGATLKALEKYASGLASDEYGQAFDRYANQRNYDRGVYEDERDTGRRNFESDRGFGRSTYESDRGFDYTNYKDLRDFMESGRRFGLQYDRDTAVSDRDYAENQRRYNLGFDRDTATSDRSFIYQTFKDLAQMGLQSGQLDANSANALAALLAQISLAEGNAGAAGAVGGANAINDLVSGLLRTLIGNKTVNTVKNGG